MSYQEMFSELMRRAYKDVIKVEPAKDDKDKIVYSPLPVVSPILAHNEAFWTPITEFLKNIRNFDMSLPKNELSEIERILRR